MTATVQTTSAQIPSKAVASGGEDLVTPVRTLLESLYLLGTKDDVREAGAPATLFGPPASVAVIEAGATALSKWWAAGGSAALTAGWVWAGTHWPTDQDTVRVVIWTMGIFSAALVLAIGLLLATDVRSRGTAAAATIAARAAIADAVIAAAASAAVHRVVPLARPLDVTYLKVGAAEAGWVAVATQTSANGDGVRFLIQKGPSHVWVSEDEVGL